MGLGWWRSIGAAFAAAFLFLGFPSSQTSPDYAFIQHSNSAPLTSYYDYIIVGGGTSGCPLAATLSQNYTVLLLERGGSPYGNPNITNLASFGVPLSDLSPASPAQRFVSEDGVINSRARVLGGGSCINAGFYSRAPADYVREAGWDGELVKESYRWVEEVVAFEPPMGRWQAAVRDGLIEAGVLPNNGFTYDHIEGTKVGGSIFDGKGSRHTAADLLKYANPDRLRVLIHATVHKILFRRIKGEGKPIAHGVIYRDASGMKHKAYLNRGPKNEIILSAGALGSPQLLMLSGVGPAEHLKAHKIHVVLDQPMVGQGMSDNPMNTILVPSPTPVEVSVIEVVGITPFGSYIEAASGKSFLGGFPLKTIPSQTRAPRGVKVEEADLTGGFILEKIIGPASTGHLELRNRNPNDNPSVTFNYFKEAADLERCVEGVKVVQRIIDSKAFFPFMYENTSSESLLAVMEELPMNLVPKHRNKSLSPLERFCKDTVMTIWHYHGGCWVGQVVDSDYRVLGVDALRVIDGSTFVNSPGTNPQATVMMLGRYMGVRVLKERFASDVSK
ncbi:protein HOTHEAD-like [Malania oleifera]|uniref:protein HOTHEAD-like n=1 Tax=Malania oleifera TaxID=397392 RepID=UPI0025AE61F5|nr:protein HOTHEAD-like [Malania oleifera]